MTINKRDSAKQGEEVLNTSKDISIDSSFYLDAISTIITECFYIMDERLKQFHYIPQNDFFLCGNSTEKAMELGFDFFKLITHPDDYTTLKDVYYTIIDCLSTCGERRDEIDFFSCTFRLIKNYSFLSDPLPHMTISKIKPVWKDGMLLYFICSIKNTIIKESGNLRMYYKNKIVYKEYNPKAKRWIPESINTLTERELAILMLAKQGLRAKEIANIFNREYKTIDTQITAMYNKLGVHSIYEACVIYDDFHMNHI